MEHAVRVARTALVVDDDAFMVSAMADILTQDGYQVHTASNGFSALRVASECQPAIVLLDLALPERSGNEVLSELRTDPATRFVPIVVVTANPDGLSERQLADADGLVVKPFDSQQMLQTVERAVQFAATREAAFRRVAPTRSRGAAGRRTAGVRRTRGRR